MNTIEENKTTIEEPIEEEKTKKCCNCKEIFNINFFDKIGKAGKCRSNCKTCRKQQNKETYQRKKEKALLNKELPQPPVITAN